MKIILVLVTLLLAAGCSDDGVEPIGDVCDISSLPLSGDTDAPVITDVGLEVQEGSGGIVAVATATDPQGFDNVRDILQTIGVFPDERCEGAPLVIRDDLAGLDQEETFGTVVDPADNPELYQAIAASNRWPVELSFEDFDGNRTTGRVFARIIR